MAKRRTNQRKNSAVSLLGQIATKSTKTRSSKSPVVNITDPEKIRAIKEIIEAKNAERAAVSALKAAEGKFRDTANELFETRCREDGTIYSSVQFVGHEDHTPLALSFVQPRKCVKMTENEASDPLHKIFGDEFDELFAPKRTIEINTDILTDEQIVKVVEGLQEALGEIFQSAVSVDSLIFPKEAFFRRRILDDRIRKLARQAAEEGYAKLTQPFFKV